MMLKSLKIRNFRNLNRLDVDHLARVNLIVGRNNIGKSSLLEALFLYQGNATLRKMICLLAQRDEDQEYAGVSDDDWYPIHLDPCRHLFTGFDLKANAECGIFIGEDDAQFLSVIPKIVPNDLLDEDDIHLTICRNAEETGSQSLRQLTITKRKHLLKINAIPENAGNLQYLNNSNKHLMPSAPALWDKAFTNIEHRQVILNAMRLIEPELSEIVMVGAKPRIAMALFHQKNIKIPLASMGEGMTRLFHIILAILNAENGLLLLDEIENGLYYDLQTPLWRILFELAETLNVQIFATTHSKDVVDSFSDLLQENEEWNGQVIKLTRTKRQQDQIVARVMDHQTLERGELIAREVR